MSLENVYLNDIPLDIFMKYFNTENLANNDPLQVTKYRQPYVYSLKAITTEDSDGNSTSITLNKYYGYYRFYRFYIGDEDTAPYSSGVNISNYWTYASDPINSPIPFMDAVYNLKSTILHKSEGLLSLTFADGTTTVTDFTVDEDAMFPAKSAPIITDIEDDPASNNSSQKYLRPVYSASFPTAEYSTSTYTTTFTNFDISTNFAIGIESEDAEKINEYTDLDYPNYLTADELEIVNRVDESWYSYYPYTSIPLIRENGVYSAVTSDFNVKVAGSNTITFTRPLFSETLYPVYSTTEDSDGNTSISLTSVKSYLCDNFEVSVQAYTVVDDEILVMLSETSNNSTILNPNVNYILFKKNTVLTEEKYTSDGKLIYLDSEGNEVYTQTSDSTLAQHHELFALGSNIISREEAFVGDDPLNPIYPPKMMIRTTINGTDKLIAYNLLIQKTQYNYLESSPYTYSSGTDYTDYFSIKPLVTYIHDDLDNDDGVYSFYDYSYKDHEYFDFDAGTYLELDKDEKTKAYSLTEACTKYSDGFYYVYTYDSIKNGLMENSVQNLTYLYNGALTEITVDSTSGFTVDLLNNLYFTYGSVETEFGKTIYDDSSVSSSTYFNNTFNNNGYYSNSVASLLNKYYDEEYQIYFSIGYDYMTSDARNIGDGEELLPGATKESTSHGPELLEALLYTHITSGSNYYYYIRPDAVTKYRRSSSITPVDSYFYPMTNVKDSYFNKSAYFSLDRTDGAELAQTGRFTELRKEALADMYSSRFSNLINEDFDIESSFVASDGLMKIYVYCSGLYTMLNNVDSLVLDQVSADNLIDAEDLDTKMILALPNSDEKADPDEVELAEDTLNELIDLKVDEMKESYDQDTNTFIRLHDYNGFALAKDQIQDEALLEAYTQYFENTTATSVDHTFDVEKYEVDVVETTSTRESFIPRLVMDIVGYFDTRNSIYLDDYYTYLKPKIYTSVTTPNAEVDSETGVLNVIMTTVEDQELPASVNARSDLTTEKHVYHSKYDCSDSTITEIANYILENPRWEVS